jgi:tRNA(fMet)-specific endonuclease VapC
MICLDTNAVIVAINHLNPRVRARFDQAIRDRLSINLPSIVVFELWYGIFKSLHRQRSIVTLTHFLAGPVQILNFDADDAREAGEIRAALARRGTPIGPYDILIAAQARRRDATLVTANAREFSRVPGLKTEDWANGE